MLQRKGSRYIRRESLWSRVTSYPFDFLLWANELISSTPWDDYADSIALPGGYLLSLLYLFTIKISKYNSDNNKKRQNPVFHTDRFDYERIRAKAANLQQPLSSYSSILFYIINVVSFILFIFSIVNAFNLFTSYRNYTLMYADIDQLVKTPSAHKITLSNDNTTPSTWDKVLNSIYLRTRKSNPNSSFQSSDDSDLDETTIDEINLIEKDIWELSVWTPSSFRLKLSSSFSPVITILVYLLAEDLPVWKILLIGGMISLTFQFSAARFLILLQDKQIMYQQMFSEYNDKFVKPKMSVLKKEVVVDATYGPEAPAVLTVKTDLQPYLQKGQSKVFMTHDINGKAYNNVSISKKKYDDRMYNDSVKYTPSIRDADLQVQRPLDSPFKSPLRRDEVFSSTPYRQNSKVYDRSLSLHYDKNTSSTHERSFGNNSFCDRSGGQFENDRFSRPLSPRREYQGGIRSPQRLPQEKIADRSSQRLSPDRLSPNRYDRSISQQTPLQRLKAPLEKSVLGSRRQSLPRSPSPTKRSWK